LFQLEIVTDGFRNSQFTNFRIRRTALDMASITLGLGVLTYSISQACSLFFRSGIIALAMGMFCSIMAYLWAALMWTLEVPLWFAVLPIPLIAVWASWLRAPEWLSEKTRWRARLKLLFSLAIPLAAVLVATACFRAYEVPVVRLDLPEPNHPQPPSDDVRETLRLYHESWSLSESTANAEEAIAKFVEASRREHCWFPNAYTLRRQSHTGTISEELKDVETLVTYPMRLADFVLDSCDSSESDGKLDEVFERCMAVLRFARHLYYRGDLRRQRGADAVEAMALERLSKWATRPSQDADNIRAALQRLEQEYFVFSPSREYDILDDYLERRDILEFDETAWENSGAVWQERAVFRCLHVVLPCEHARVKRVSAACTASQLERIRSAQRLLAENGCVRDAVDPFHERNLRWAETTPLLWGNPYSLSVYEDWRLDLMAGHETRRRIARVRLGLAAWRAEHGELPETLDKLAGNELDSLPVDPFTGRPFLYRPRGVSWPVQRRDTPKEAISTGDVHEEQVLAGTPLLWSAGPNLIYFPRGGQGEAAPEDYQHMPRRGSAIVLRSEQEVWSLGWCFPIP